MTASGTTVPSAEFPAFGRTHHIKRLSLFGSVLGPDFQPDSDIDLLGEFEPRRRNLTAT